MKKIQTKTILLISISSVLSIITVFSLYGFGWGINAEKNLLYALAGLPNHQKWEIDGNIVLSGQLLETPIILDFNSLVKLSPKDGQMDSHWQIQGEPFGKVNLLNLAQDGSNWLLEIPVISKDEIWQMAVAKSVVSKEDILHWIKELQFQKVGYQLLNEEYGRSISCLHLKSEVNTLPMKLINWLEKLVNKDLSSKGKQELQNIVKDSLQSTIDVFVTPDMKIMEVAIALNLRANLAFEITFIARPQQGQELNFEYYYVKEKKEINVAVLEKLLSILEDFESRIQE